MQWIPLLLLRATSKARFKPPVRGYSAGRAGFSWPVPSALCQHVLETADASLGGALSKDPILAPSQPVLGAQAASAMRSLPRREAKSVGEVVRVALGSAAADVGRTKPVGSNSSRRAHIDVHTLSMAPPVFLAHNVLSPQDCAALRQLAAPHLRPGTGHHAATAATLEYSAAVPVLRRLVQATAAVTGISEAYVERNVALQVLRYPPGGYVSSCGGRRRNEACVQRGGWH